MIEILLVNQPIFEPNLTNQTHNFVIGTHLQYNILWSLQLLPPEKSWVWLQTHQFFTALVLLKSWRTNHT